MTTVSVLPEKLCAVLAMTSSALFAQAKQGDPLAIAGLLNRSLQPQGITATVASIEQGLQIHLEADHPIPLEPLLRFIRRGLIRLRPRQIDRAELTITTPEQATPIWQGTLTLVGEAMPSEQALESAALVPSQDPIPPRQLLRPGQLLQQRYQLEKPLADTGVRKTWLAQDRHPTGCESATVVVKLLTFGGEMKWNDFKLFEREAMILKHLRHEQIPSYRDYFTLEGPPAWFGLVYTYVPGCSLKEVLQQHQRLTEDQVRHIARDVLGILLYLHGLSPPILHRDIKPSNLIWGEDGRTYLVDFGSVQDQGQTTGRTFTVVGTYGYAPVEQFGGRAVPASDLYGLGATLIHLLTGSSPADLPQQELRIQFADRVSADPGFVNWIAQLVEPAPEHRYATAHQALAALNSALSSAATACKGSLRPTLAAKEWAALATSTPRPEQLLSRFSAPELAPHQQPHGSRIQVESSSTQLHVHIPPEPLSSLGIKIGLYSLGIMVPLWVLCASVGVWVGVGVSPLIGIGVSLLLLRHQLTDTVIQMDRRQFSIRHYSLGFSQTHQGYTSTILDVYQETLYPSGSETGSQPLGHQITVQVGIRGYSVGRSLTRVECLWLAQTIQRWLEG